jgi:hypothetical protein
MVNGHPNLINMNSYKNLAIKCIIMFFFLKLMFGVGIKFYGNSNITQRNNSNSKILFCGFPKEVKFIQGSSRGNGLHLIKHSTIYLITLCYCKL